MWQAIVFGQLLFPRAGDIEQTVLPASMAKMLFLSDFYSCVPTCEEKLYLRLTG